MYQQDKELYPEQYMDCKDCFAFSDQYLMQYNIKDAHKFSFETNVYLL